MEHALIWGIAAASILMMLFRPFRLPEAISTGAGALLLCILRLIPVRLAAHAVAEGLDVYLFLTGMMLLSELAKIHGVFDWLANIAVRRAAGSSMRLFTLIYGVGTLVTIFMSNDATAVVLTPAVLSSVKRAKAEPVPHLFTCALIANAASFVLPISNPANLVVFHSAMPSLRSWLAMFAVPSAVSVVTTYLLLRWSNRKILALPCARSEERVDLSPMGRICLFGIIAVALVLLIASAFNIDLGLPTCIAALVVATIALLKSRSSPVRLIRDISWSVLPLVAALFVIVEAVKTAGALDSLHYALEHAMHWPSALGALVLGTTIGFGSNLVNNLPLGLITGAVLHTVPFHALLSEAALIGVDLGPNLSITGSLATILWLIAIRREGMNVGGWQFLKTGLLIMPLSLLLTVCSAILLSAR